MSRPSVLIVGVGVVSAAGANVAATLDTFRQGRRNWSVAKPFETSICSPTFQVEAELAPLPAPRHNCRTLRLAMAAIGEALAEAELGPNLSHLRVGVCLGTTVASQLNSIPFYDGYRRSGHPALEPVHDFLNANLAEAVADLLRLTGPRMTVVNACSSGSDAIGIACSWLRAGLCDVAIAGGADELSRVALAGFSSLGVMSPQPCAPFDRDRQGLNLGEGAGILILESAQHAQACGRKATCEVAGFGAGCDAHHLTAPHPEGRGLQRAIEAALAQAGAAPSQVAFINAHGTATLDNDRVEAGTIARIFGASTPFLSTKGYTGHTLGAAGGLEAAFTVLGLIHGWIPASAGFENKPDDMPIAPVRQITTVGGELALSTSLAFGGNNAALLLRRTA